MLRLNKYITWDILTPTSPLDRGSALFRADLTYVASRNKFEAERQEEILARHWLWAGFQEQPFQKEPMTDMLSQWTFKQASQWPVLTSHTTAYLITTISAHPMSWPIDDQPATRIPMPHDVEASTQIPISTTGRASKHWWGLGIDKVNSYHESWVIHVDGKWCKMWSLGNFERNCERSGRCAQPWSYTRVMCWSEPWRDATHFLFMWEIGGLRKLEIFLRSHRCFSADNGIVQVGRSHSKPMCEKELLRLWPLCDMGCQGNVQ